MYHIGLTHELLLEDTVMLVLMNFNLTRLGDDQRAGKALLLVTSASVFQGHCPWQAA